MPNVLLTPLTSTDVTSFVQAVQRSSSLHKGWVEPPSTPAAFEQYIGTDGEVRQRYAIRNSSGELVGIANVNAIIRGAFQNGCLGFYSFVPYNGQGYMRSALTGLIALAFTEHVLHRLEANVQPENVRSCSLIESLGFRLEALSPRYLRVAGVWRDHKRYALTCEEWQPYSAT
jgi:ribosomal-protein-alanine N-acetyltransferase